MRLPFIYCTADSDVASARPNTLAAWILVERQKTGDFLQGFDVYTDANVRNVKREVSENAEQKEKEPESKTGNKSQTPLATFLAPWPASLMNFQGSFPTGNIPVDTLTFEETKPGERDHAGRLSIGGRTTISLEGLATLASDIDLKNPPHVAISLSYEASEKGSIRQVTYFPPDAKKLRASTNGHPSLVFDSTKASAGFELTRFVGSHCSFPFPEFTKQFAHQAVKTAEGFYYWKRESGQDERN